MITILQRRSSRFDSGSARRTEVIFLNIYNSSENSSPTATLLGLVALLIWSSSVAFSKSLSQQIGPMTAAASVYFTAGVLGIVIQALTQQKMPRASRTVPLAYWLGGGVCFILYYFGLFTALGLASNAQQVMEVTLVNYMWPSLTIALSVPILHRHARSWLIPGMLLTLAGIALGLFPNNGQGYSLEVLRLNLRHHWAPYLIMGIGAAGWALYSNLSRRYGVNGGTILPFFLLATGCVMIPLRFAFHETTIWTVRALWEFGFMTIFVALLGNLFWNFAMRRGNLTLVSLAAYFTPILAILFNGLYLRIGLSWNLCLAGLLVIAGAILCKVSIKESSG
ncbi:MAG: EamA family transporter [Verrucomicrobia bacterium]|nr:EamA family transporter [Verrucomicrobiota bacterium]MBU4290730.1 EamA family transporter [Verrucomicrobiota bacterium]MBU4429084.1 EamA family transporter [Verrucomicrobiota bacterium]MCG2680009.1 EamA family transporter [Kiritimatiellia bacterium]